ncbi:RNA-dependent ATPase rok1 [Phlyctochytrium bullatum]|nr:RNA-dependent ATPase rok1 [Phlyctochytrium bullatum]
MAFSVLSGGIRFDKKRFSGDVAVFKDQSDNTLIERAAVRSALKLDELPPGLDFFGSFDKGDKKKEKKRGGQHDDEEESHKRPRTTDDDLEEDEDDEYVDEFDTEDDIHLFRKKHKISVQGTDVPAPSKTFRDLAKRFKFKKFLRSSLLSLGHTVPTPIQMQSIPCLIYRREIERQIKLLVKKKPFKVHVLEKSMVSASNESKANPLKFDIVITTPMRLVHAIENNLIKLDRVKHLILDEADKLLELGFLEQLDEIFAACTHPELRKSLFSATMPSGIESLARTFMDDPVRIIIGHANAATDTIKQRLKYVGEESGKLIEIRQMVIGGELKPPVLVFVQSIDRARELFRELVYDGIKVDVMHAERTKAQRDAVIEAFRTGKTWVLISTDLMARGIDFKGVQLVINYDFPQSVQSYIHRIGRTGRAGRQGEAVTFFTKEDAPYLKMNIIEQSKKAKSASESGNEGPSEGDEVGKPGKGKAKKVQSLGKDDEPKRVQKDTDGVAKPKKAKNPSPEEKKGTAAPSPKVKKAKKAKASEE